MSFSVLFVRSGSPVNSDHLVNYLREESVVCDNNCGHGTYAVYIEKSSPPSQEELLEKKNFARSLLKKDCPFHNERSRILL